MEDESITEKTSRRLQSTAIGEVTAGCPTGTGARSKAGREGFECHVFSRKGQKLSAELQPCSWLNMCLYVHHGSH